MMFCPRARHWLNSTRAFAPNLTTGEMTMTNAAHKTAYVASRVTRFNTADNADRPNNRYLLTSGEWSGTVRFTDIPADARFESVDDLKSVLSGTPCGLSACIRRIT